MTEGERQKLQRAKRKAKIERMETALRDIVLLADKPGPVATAIRAKALEALA